MNEKEVEFSILKDKVLTSIEVNRNDEYQEYILFKTQCGRMFKMLHKNHCCETVTIEDICGEIEWILNSAILLADERIQEGEFIEHSEKNRATDTYTWTFYELATIKGAVTIRWYGQSNGYYSERVDLIEVVND